MRPQSRVGETALVVLVVDVETTGLSPESAEIIEFAAVRWEDGVVSDTFQTLIRPTRPLEQEIQELTGITNALLQTAPAMEEALPRILAFISGMSLAGHHVAFDIEFLQAACEAYGYNFPASVDALDTRQLGRILLPLLQEFRLADLAAACSVPVNSVHRALADAQTTADVLTKLRSLAHNLPYVTLQTLEQLAGTMSPSLANWFNESSATRFTRHGTSLPPAMESIQQLVFSSRQPVAPMTDPARELDGAIDDIKATSATLLSEGSPIGAALPGFQVRAGQRQMVEAVADAFLGAQHLIAEAGTGTGKSLAYLVPAALFALQSEERVVIATHTIALQDQIRDRDFSTLRSVIPAPLSLAVFKGRTHYVCMRKLWQELRTVGIGTPMDEVVAYMALVTWLTTTPEGNREELSHGGRLSEVWPRVQSETETCINKRCPFFKQCYYFRARQAAFDANVVVTNHSLILADLKADHRVLPKYDKLVLDEAHHLEEEATRHLGAEVHLAHCMALFGRLTRDAGRHGVLAELTARLTAASGTVNSAQKTLEHLGEILPTMRSTTESAFQALAQLIPSGQNEFRLTSASESASAWQRYLQMADVLSAHLTNLGDLQAALQDAAEMESDEELSGRLFDAHGFVYELLSNVATLVDAGDISDDYVQWIERSSVSERGHLSFHRVPIDVGKILAETLFENKSSVVLTSATLSVDGKFDYLMSRLGLTDAQANGRVASMMVPSPFDFPRQALVCVPTDVPELAKLDAAEAAAWISDSLFQLAKASEGRLLALFTSHALLRATAAILRQPLRKAGLALLAQGIDGSRTRLLEAFRAHPNAVLFGAQSFWEGIDLPGDQLTTLVIVRLPFSPPTHPVTAARHELLERQGKSAFWAASLPEAVVRFRQGFGRLIRTIHDRGVVVVYDKRIVTTKYGSTFIKSLPGVRPYIAPEADVIRRVRQFLHETETSPGVSE